MAFLKESEPANTVAVIEGYTRQSLVYSETAEIAGGGQVPPGDRCVQLAIRTCVAGSCGEPTVCAFVDYFVAGQKVHLKAGSLKLDQPASSGEAIVNGTMQVEVSAKGFATATRRIAVRCGTAVRGVCERGSPELPRQAIPVQSR
jgi:hypothetical protein